VVIHNGIKPEAIPQHTTTKRKCLGFLGNLIYQKDPTLFVEIVRELAPEGYSAKMVGGGDLEKRVRHLVQRCGLTDKVEITGALSHHEALKKISDVGVLVLPSRWEGLPVAPIEAMHMGIPVVAADVGGMPEIIESEVSGVLISGRRSMDFARAIRRITVDSELRNQIILEARSRVVREFSHRRVVDLHLGLYKSLLDGGVVDA
jgi:glycosyltransferase involved in cell wall biosynthesis